MKKIIKGTLILALAVAASACGLKLYTSSDFDHSVDFTQYHTYSFYLQASLGVSEFNDVRIRNSIKEVMSSKGYVESDENPDLLIDAISMMLNKQSVSINANNRGYRPGPMASSIATMKTTNYKEGTLVIEVIDTKTGKLVWTGTGSGEVTKQPRNLDQAVKEIVSKIMNGFPAYSVTAKK